VSVFGWTLASGHAISALSGAAPVAGLALVLFDIGTVWLLPLTRRRVRSDAPPAATRRAARRAAKAAGRTPGTRALLRRASRVFLLPRATTSLPRSLRGPFAAAIWVTIAAASWQLVASMLEFFGLGDTSAMDQRLAALFWMMHLIIWCEFACERLSTRRAGPVDRYWGRS
jgi:hypothetical protein